MATGGKSADSYYAAAQNLPGAFLRRTFTDNGLTEGEVRIIHAKALDSKTSELLGQLSGSVDGRIDNGAGLANRRRSEQQERAKAKSRNDDRVLMALLDNIERMENDLADRYGENFAGDLLSDLHVKGLVEEQEYTRIMAITDDTERRRAIAVRIQEGLENGTIRPEDLEGHPWAQDWLSEHQKATDEMTREAARYERGEVSANEIDRDAKDQATHLMIAQSADAESEIEAVTVQDDQSGNEVLKSEDQLAASIDFTAIMKPG